jgi:predicted amidohydrolase
VTLRIAVVQFEIAQQDTPKNLERIEMFVRQAAEQKANVVVFPEDCVTPSPQIALFD